MTEAKSGNDTLKRKRRDSTDEAIEEYFKVANAIHIPKIIGPKWILDTTKSLKKSIQENTKLRSIKSIDPLKFLDSETNIHILLTDLQDISDADNLEILDTFIDQLGESLFKLLKHPNSDIIDDVNLVFQSLLSPIFFIDEDIEDTDDLLDLEDPINDILSDDESEDVEGDEGKNVIFYVIYKDLFGKMIKNLEKIESGSPSLSHSTRIVFGVISNALNFKYRDIRGYIFENSSIISKLRSLIIEANGRDSYESYIVDLFQISSYDPERFIRKYPGTIDDLSKALSIIKDKPLESDKDERNGFINELVILLKLLFGEPEGVEQFVKYEGFQLLILILKGQTSENLKIFNSLINFLLTTTNDERNVKFAKAIINSNVFLQNYFKLFNEKFDKLETYQYVKVLTNLLSLLPFDSTERIRLIGKLTSKNFKNLDALTNLERKYSKNFKNNFDYDDGYSSKIWDGLNVLQEIIILKTWIYVEDIDKDLKSKYVSLEKFDLKRTKSVLQGYEKELLDDLKLGKNKDIEVKNKLNIVQELQRSLI